MPLHENKWVAASGWNSRDLLSNTKLHAHFWDCWKVRESGMIGHWQTLKNTIGTETPIRRLKRLWKDFKGVFRWQSWPYSPGTRYKKQQQLDDGRFSITFPKMSLTYQGTSEFLKFQRNLRRNHLPLWHFSHLCISGPRTKVYRHQYVEEIIHESGHSAKSKEIKAWLLDCFWDPSNYMDLRPMNSSTWNA